MRHILLTLAALALPVSASAQQALGNLAGCERVAGQMESSDNVIILWPDRIERWESFCKIVHVEGDLNRRSIIMTECYGEGEMRAQDYGMTPVGEDMFAIWPLGYPDVISELRMCE